jgi:LPXTG-motif cell wall-anchored protein
VNQTSLRRRLFAGAAGLMLGTTALLTLAAPAQATQEGEETTTTEAPPPTEPEPTATPTPAPEPPDDGGLGQDVQGDFVTIVTCDAYVFIFRNNGEEDGLSFSLTPNQATTIGDAPDFVPLLDAVPDEDGFIEIPPDATLENTEAIGADETAEFGPLGVGDAEAHGFVPAAGLEVTVTVTIGEEQVELEEPVASFDEDAEGLGCGDDGEGGELPTTGISTGIIAGGAVLLLALGGGLFLIARRRRVTFQA